MAELRDWTADQHFKEALVSLSIARVGQPGSERAAALATAHFAAAEAIMTRSRLEGTGWDMGHATWET